MIWSLFPLKNVIQDALLLLELLRDVFPETVFYVDRGKGNGFMSNMYLERYRGR